MVVRGTVYYYCFIHIYRIFPPTLVQILSQDDWLQRWVLPPSCLPFSELLVHLYIGCFEFQFSLVKVWLLLGCWVEIAKQHELNLSHFSVLFPKLFSSKHVGLPAGFPPTAPPELQGEAGPCGPEGLGGGAQEQWRLQQGEGLSRCCLRGSLGTEDQVELSADLSAETGDRMVGWWPPGMAWWNFGCNMWRKKTLFMILCAYLFGW